MKPSPVALARVQAGSTEPVALVPAVAKTDTEMQKLVEDDDPHVAALCAARLGKKSTDQSLRRLETMRCIAGVMHGRIPVQLEYYGARTGRWSGSGGLNFQNFGRTGWGLKIRSLLVPAPGHVLVIGDLAQIEARITAKLAQQKDLLEAFAQGRDIYSEFASAIFHREVRKAKPEDPPDLAKLMSAYRQVGKQAILGLGYGLGAYKFLGVMRSDPTAKQFFTELETAAKLCYQIVQLYRKTYSHIPELWKKLEDFFKRAVKGEVFKGKVQLQKIKSGLRDTSFLRAQLPSGRALYYPKPRLEEKNKAIKYLDQSGDIAEFTPIDKTIVYGKGTTLYGGKITENLVQAIARDVLAEAILRLEALGRRVVMHVHDEVIIQVPEAEAEAALADVKRELSRTPEWAEGLPVACEAGIARRYGK